MASFPLQVLGSWSSDVTKLCGRGPGPARFLEILAVCPWKSYLTLLVFN